MSSVLCSIVSEDHFRLYAASNDLRISSMTEELAQQEALYRIYAMPPMLLADTSGVTRT